MLILIDIQFEIFRQLTDDKELKSQRIEN